MRTLDGSATDPGSYYACWCSTFEAFNGANATQVFGKIWGGQLGYSGIFASVLQLWEPLNIVYCQQSLDTSPEIGRALVPNVVKSTLFTPARDILQPPNPRLLAHVHHMRRHGHDHVRAPRCLAPDVPAVVPRDDFALPHPLERARGARVGVPEPGSAVHGHRAVQSVLCLAREREGLCGVHIAGVGYVWDGQEMLDDRDGGMVGLENKRERAWFLLS